MTNDEMLNTFRKFCLSERSVADENILNDTQWDEMSLGFFLALGATATVAKALAYEASFVYDYWMDGDTW